ncbi:MAG: hypothetical protein IJZ09_03290 [Tidjanibacter sp.]|nr:hypothetical protein [Tidjanibacter sp.]
MKRVLLIMALLLVAVLPQNLLAQQPASSNLSDYYVSDISKSIDVNRMVYNLSKWGTLGGASVVAASTILYVVGAEKTKNSGSDSASLEQGMGMMGMILGGMSVVASLPFYLWGLHLEQQADGSTLIIGENPKGWGGLVDFGCGIEKTFGIGGSFGYNFGRQLFVGLGAGCEYYIREEYGEYEEPYCFPAYIDLRLKFGKSRLVPYIGLKGGIEVSSVPVSYGSVEWGVSYQPQHSRGAWMGALGLSTTRHLISVRVARSF